MGTLVRNQTDLLRLVRIESQQRHCAHELFAANCDRNRAITAHPGPHSVPAGGELVRDEVIGPAFRAP